MDLSFKQETQHESFGITVILRDAQGNPTGRTKTLHSDKAYKISDFYNRHRGKPKRKKKRKLPKTKDAEKHLKEVGEYAEKKQADRDRQNING